MSPEQHENTAPYVLGALSELEARAFERHLERCAECRAQVELLRPAVDALAEGVDPVEPPPGLRRELMRRVAEEAPADAPQTARRAAPKSAPAHRFRGLLTAVRPAVAVAAAALAALAGVAGYGLGRGDEEGRTLTATVDRDRVGRAAANLSLPGDDAAPALLRVRGLPLPAERRVYEVWVLRGGRAEPASVFTVRADGTAEVPVPQDLERAQAVMVTREREGGAVSPTERPVITVRLD